MRTDNIPGYPYYYVSKRGNVYTRKLRGSNKGTLGNWYKLKVNINHFYGKRGEKHPASVLSDRDRLDILRLYKKGKTQKELGKIFGVSQGAISRTIKKYTL